MFLLPQEETYQTAQDYEMVISDALPVQFWLEDCDTYNEGESYGVHPICWHQPFACEDEIKIQFKSNPLTDYNLRIIDEDGSTLETLPFTVESSSEYFANYPFSGWETIDGTGPAWTEGNTPSVVLGILGSGNNISERLNESISGLAAGVYNFTYSITTTGDATITVTFRKNGTSVSTISSILLSGAATHSATISVTLSDTPDQITVTASNFGLSGITVTLTSFTMTNSDTFSLNVVPLDYEICDQMIKFEIWTDASPAERVAKSDYLDIKQTHPDTRLFSYTNNRNFAGLVYENISPVETFYIRVRCRFYHRRFPQNDEAMELTSSIITTSSQHKRQRLLEVIHAPYYFHDKLISVLQHHTVQIDNIYWKKEESYDVNEGEKRWPLKSATCYLTEKNSVIRNVI